MGHHHRFALNTPFCGVGSFNHYPRQVLKKGGLQLAARALNSEDSDVTAIPPPLKNLKIREISFHIRVFWRKGLDENTVNSE